MSDTGDRAVSALYITDPQLSRPWSMALDGLPNQGQLDTSVPSHAVDLDAIQRAGTTTPPTVRHEYPRLPLERRTTRLGRAAWWALERAPAAIGLTMILILIVAYMRHATP